VVLWSGRVEKGGVQAIRAVKKNLFLPVRILLRFQFLFIFAGKETHPCRVFK
jgi:hypothetical protein